MSNRIFDPTSLEKLSYLISVAKDNGLSFSIDFISYSRKSIIDEDIWIAQVYDEHEKTIVSANGKNANAVIRKLHDNWIAKTSPRI